MNKRSVKFALSAFLLTAGALLYATTKETDMQMELIVSAQKNGKVKSLNTYRVNKDSEGTVFNSPLYFGNNENNITISIGIVKVDRKQVILEVGNDRYTVGKEEVTVEIDDTLSVILKYVKEDN